MHSIHLPAILPAVHPTSKGFNTHRIKFKADPASSYGWSPGISRPIPKLKGYPKNMVGLCWVDHPKYVLNDHIISSYPFI